jgi:signal peptidase I
MNTIGAMLSRAKRAVVNEIKLWREHVNSIAWAVALALVIRIFVMAPFKIPSGSMRPTLIEGDRILVNKFIHRFEDPKRGEITVFKYPEDPKRPFIKRLVGLERDRVEIRRGQVLVNGAALASPAIFQTNQYYNQGDYGQAGQVIDVPEGHLFVLGDNSASSKDSRYWGFVPKKYLIGRAMCIFWPPNRIRVLR